MRRRLVAAVVLAAVVVLGFGGWQVVGGMSAEAGTRSSPPDPCIQVC